MKRFLFLCAMILCAVPAFSATYYISASGNDDADGTSPATAWCSTGKVNSTQFQPGDKILFKRGDLWRGGLIPSSGEPGKPTLYGAYGDGELPTIYGSVDASDPARWTEVSPGIWKIDGAPKYQRGEKMSVDLTSEWSLHTEGGAEARLNTQMIDGQKRITLTVIKSGTAPNHIQIWGPRMENPVPRNFEIILRVRASVPCTVPSLRVDENGSPWRPAAIGVFLNPKEDWTEQAMLMSQAMKPSELEHAVRLHWSLGMLPAGTFEFELKGMSVVQCDRTGEFGTDIGNIIFDHGNSKAFFADKPERREPTCGTKKWDPKELKEPGDFFYNGRIDKSTTSPIYDGGTSYVLLRSDGNPATLCKSIELAKRNATLNMGGKHDVILENLAIKYTAAHGLGGGNTKRLTIRKCEFSYIGGAHQFTHPNGWPVRFGNAIEFWGSAEGHLVEENRIWEVYDAALTNQGRGSEESPSNECNITYRNNVIWNCEYSFEYWNSGGVTENILFEGNRCFDAGNVWSHTQRPDKNGGHVMFYNNKAATKNFVVRNNVFCNSTEVCLRMCNDWRDSLTFENNTYWQDKNPLVRYIDKYYQKDELERFQKELGMDAGSVLKKEER